jgi:transcriptional regulator with XRE-family HTH domain
MNKAATDKQFLTTLGHRLRGIRETKGWTLEDTEDQGWPSWRHLQQIETGNKNVTVLTLRKLSRLYNLKLSELLQGL